MNLALISQQLATLNPGYSAKLVEAEDGTVDSEIQVLLHGQATRWAIQIGLHNDFFVNEYGFENGELDSVTHRGMFPNLERAALALCALLQREQ